jgi:hypothetical protein
LSWTRTVPRSQRDAVGVVQPEASGCRSEVKRRGPGLRTWYVDPTQQHLDLLTERELLRLLCSWVPGGEMHHGVGVPVGEDVYGNTPGHDHHHKDSHPAFEPLPHVSHGGHCCSGAAGRERPTCKQDETPPLPAAGRSTVSFCGQARQQFVMTFVWREIHTPSMIACSTHPARPLQMHL